MWSRWSARTGQRHYPKSVTLTDKPYETQSLSPYVLRPKTKNLSLKPKTL